MYQLESRGLLRGSVCEARALNASATRLGCCIMRLFHPGVSITSAAWLEKRGREGEGEEEGDGERERERERERNCLHSLMTLWFVVQHTSYIISIAHSVWKKPRWPLFTLYERKYATNTVV